jgi:RNA polymerase sigma factor (sigma-70 family)
MPALTRLLATLRRLEPRQAGSDADLLGRFASLRDEAAFTALLARHGPMVLNTCRRVLGDADDAEDAFQAAFLVLARKAGAIARPDALAGWLHGVACRVALKARRSRRPREPADVDCADRRPDPLEVVSARDLLAAVEEEVSRLPEAYRLPIVLCWLEGLSQDEAARRLGASPGAIKGRLERGRRRLHERLARRGLAPAALAALVAAGQSVARVPEGLLGETGRAALLFAAGGSVAGVSEQVLTLAKGGLEAMAQTKYMAVVAVVVALGAAGAGVGWLTAGSAESGKPPEETQARERPQSRAGAERRADPVEEARKEHARLADEVRKLDEDWLKMVVEARQKLVELEEKLRDAEAEARLARSQESPEEKRLSESLQRLRNLLEERNRVAIPAEDHPTLQQRRRQIQEQQEQLDKAKSRRLTAREEAIEKLIQLRKDQVRQEETLKQLERERAAAREEAERRRDAAAERLRTLESQPARQTDRGQQSLERKIDAVLRELGELRRELERQRKERRDE